MALLSFNSATPLLMFSKNPSFYSILSPPITNPSLSFLSCSLTAIAHLRLSFLSFSSTFKGIPESDLTPNGGKDDEEEDSASLLKLDDEWGDGQPKTLTEATKLVASDPATNEDEWEEGDGVVVGGDNSSPTAAVEAPTKIVDDKLQDLK